MNRYIREPGNFITHFLPAVLALPGTYLLWQKSSTLLEETAAMVYGLGIFLLFSVSAIYHSVPKTPYGIRFWQKFDHCCIYLMIAGSFTPTALIIFDGWLRWLLFGLVWLIAVLGCLLKIFNRLKNKAVSTGLYIAMGCLIIPFIAKMVAEVPVMGLFWLFLGGVFYIGGTTIMPRISLCTNICTVMSFGICLLISEPCPIISTTTFMCLKFNLA